ncbi:hypothetical protein X777_11098 [Ooceraea biroi]|uniref:Uncharacterized protein n=1 Tax=Ooceraea biroi TaxID=2015173 RepID=A0A026W2E3_OOCBI|nr:hypothetical protein X777_11098 [Ooceraea biroi]
MAVREVKFEMATAKERNNAAALLSLSSAAMKFEITELVSPGIQEITFIAAGCIKVLIVLGIYTGANTHVACANASVSARMLYN